MPGFDGTGPEGRGPMTGGGRGYCNPRGWRAGLQGNLPRQTTPYRRNYGLRWSAPPPVSEEELGFLKNQAHSLNNELKVLEARIRELEARN